MINSLARYYREQALEASYRDDPEDEEMFAVAYLNALREPEPAKPTEEELDRYAEQLPTGVLAA